MTTTTTMTLAETLAFQVKLLREQHDSAKLHAARSIIKLPAEIARLTKISADKGLALIERIKSGDRRRGGLWKPQSSRLRRPRLGPPTGLKGSNRARSEKVLEKTEARCLRFMPMMLR